MSCTLFRRLLAGGLTFALLACQSKPTAPSHPEAPTVIVRQEQIAPTETAPNAPTHDTPKRVAVILGPGGAKTFAEIGVLKALQQQRVPVAKIVGLEWGSLIGALYANKGQINDLEWKLYKMEQQNLPRPKGFFRRGEETIRVMDDFLGESFARDEITRARISFACPTRALPSGSLSFQTHGFFKDVLRRCLNYAPTFKIDTGFVAAPSVASEAVEMLAHEGFNVIILVNVLGSSLPVAQDALPENGVHVILWQEIKRALSETSRLNVETIAVDTSAYPVTKYESLKELRQLGESAAAPAAAKLISKYGF